MGIQLPIKLSWKTIIRIVLYPVFLVAIVAFLNEAFGLLGSRSRYRESELRKILRHKAYEGVYPIDYVAPQGYFYESNGVNYILLEDLVRDRRLKIPGLLRILEDAYSSKDEPAVREYLTERFSGRLHAAYSNLMWDEWREGDVVPNQLLRLTDPDASRRKQTSQPSATPTPVPADWPWPTADQAPTQ
jgi:hypothetical protein